MHLCLFIESANPALKPDATHLAVGTSQANGSPLASVAKTISENETKNSQFFNPALLIVRMTLKSPTLSANNSISTAARLLSGH